VSTEVTETSRRDSDYLHLQAGTLKCPVSLSLLLVASNGAVCRHSIAHLCSCRVRNMSL